MTRKKKEPTEPPVCTPITIGADGVVRRAGPDGPLAADHADVICWCGQHAAKVLRYGRLSWLGEPCPNQPKVPPVGWTPPPARYVDPARRPEPTVAPSEGPKDETLPRTPPARSERKPRLVRSTSNEPVKPTGEPERTHYPDMGWLES